MIFFVFYQEITQSNHSGRTQIQIYYSADSSCSRWPLFFLTLWAFTCLCVHNKQHPSKSCEERWTERWKKRWPEIERGAHTVREGWVAARSEWFALPPSLLTPVALESIQLQPPPVKTELTFSSTQVCRIWTMKGLWSSSWHRSGWFYCFLLLSSDSISLVHTVLFGIPVIRLLHIFLIQTCMLALHQRDRFTGGKACYGLRFSFNATSTGKHPKSCRLPCHHPPQTHPCHSLLRSSFWLLVSAPVLAHKAVVLMM